MATKRPLGERRNADLKEAAKMYHEGKTQKELAEHFGTTRSNIAQRWVTTDTFKEETQRIKDFDAAMTLESIEQATQTERDKLKDKMIGIQKIIEQVGVSNFKIAGLVNFKLIEAATASGDGKTGIGELTKIGFDRQWRSSQSGASCGLQLLDAVVGLTAIVDYINKLEEKPN